MVANTYEYYVQSNLSGFVRSANAPLMVRFLGGVRGEPFCLLKKKFINH